jgi:N-methylhydantoinase A
MAAPESWIVGVDAGGTFTDLVAIQPETGEIRVAKVASTASEPSRAVVAALEEASLSDQIQRLVNGTTLATNAVLERAGARICLLTTAGFEDVAYIQRRNRRYAFNLHWQKPTPLVLRRHCIGVSERVDARGSVLEQLSEEECLRLAGEVKRLVERDGIEAIAVCLLFSYINDAHEKLLAQVLESELPTVPVSLSSVVAPIWREYERTSTVLADAYVKPLISKYVERFSSDASQNGRFPFLILKSNGGTASLESIIRRPVTTLLSGLAGGLVGARHFAARLEEEACVTLDMGGTSTDVGLLRNHGLSHLNEYELEWGLPVATPVVDVHTIGAGGGSIAQVDSGGLLRVGPESAGAVPGPACYGLGGDAPTVTDANLVLGRLDPDYFLGGRFNLESQAAQAAIARLGTQLSLDVEATAHAIIQIANENMANAIRLVTIDRGIDPRGYTLLAFGGAGPLHACGVADALGIGRIIVPPCPGLCSAFGAAIAPPRLDRVWSIGLRAEEVDVERFLAQARGVVAEMSNEIKRDGAAESLRVDCSVACRYYLQNYEQDVAIELERDSLSDAVERFHELHRRQYGYAFEGDTVEFAYFKVSVSEAQPRAIEPDWHGTTALSPTIGATRQIATADGRRLPMRVLSRAGISTPLDGPLVVEEPESTTFVAERWSLLPGTDGSLILDRKEMA